MSGETTTFLKLTNGTIHGAVSLWFSDQHQQALEMFGSIEDWDVSEVTNMSRLFRVDADKDYVEEEDDDNDGNDDNYDDDKDGFKRSYDISRWDVSNVTNMLGMFVFASGFPVPIGRWDVSKVTDMAGMFSFARSFNRWMIGMYRK